MPRKNRANKVRRAGALIYGMMVMPVLIGFGVLSVDVARLSLARTELQNAADAAARHALAGIGNGTAASRALDAADDNLVMGMPLAITSGDIETGTWNSVTRSFSPGGSSPNAVRVTARLSAARGNALKTALADFFGQGSVELSTQSVAAYSGTSSGNDMVVLGNVNLSNSARILRRSGESGAFTLAGNGTFSLTGNARINGNVRYRTDTAPTGTITGTKTKMATDVEFEDATVPAYGVTHHGAVSRSSGELKIGAGDHHFESIQLNGGLINTKDATGLVRIFVTGPISISGNSDIQTDGYATNLQIFVIGPQTINLSTTANITAMLYAPQSTLNITNAAQLQGSMVVKHLNASGTRGVEFSSTRAQSATGTGGATGNVLSVR